MTGIPLTRRQFAAACFVALLSPLMRLLPRIAVQLAGRGAFLSVIPAFFGLLPLVWLVTAYGRYMKPGEGMAQLLMGWLGPVFGRAVLLLYAGWFLFYAGFILRSGAERLVATVYPNSAVTPFVLITLALCLLTAMGTLGAAARTAVLFRAILLAVLGIVFVFSVPNISPENLLPLTGDDALPILLGAWPLMTLGGAAVCFSFLFGYVERGERPLRHAIPSMLLLLAVSALSCVEVVGTFGPGLTGQLNYPFFIMIRDVSILNLFQRIEAVVIALWVFTDYTLCTLLLRCAYEALRPVFHLSPPEGRPMFSLRRGRWVLLAEGAAAFLCSRLIPSAADEFLLWSDRIVPIVGDILIYGLLPLLWIVTAAARKKSGPPPG